MHRMRKQHCSRPLSAIGAVTLGLVLTGCSEAADPLGPGNSGVLDTQTAEANLTTFAGFFESSGWRSFEVFGERAEDSGATAAIVPGLEDWSDTSISGEDVAADATKRLFAAASRIPLISAGSLGMTFVIDPVTGEYRPDPTRSGAPSNGVRFVLYDVREGSEDPDLENEIGHVDLVDNGAAVPGIDLRLTAVAGGNTFLDYGVALEGDEAAGSVDVDGFLVHESDRLDFSFAAAATDDGVTPTLTVDATLDVDSRDFHVALLVDGVGEEDEGTFTLDLSVRFEAQSIAIAAAGDDDTMSAEFRVNGDLFATASGNSEEPTIVGADGEALSLDEIRVLEEIIEVSDEVLAFFGELLEPAGDIIELSVIL